MNCHGELKPVAYFLNKGLSYIDVWTIRNIHKVLPLSWKREMDRIDLDRDKSTNEITFVINGRIISLDMITSRNIYGEMINKISVFSLVIEKMKKTRNRDFI